MRAFACLLFLTVAIFPAVAQQPNVVLLMADDLGFGDLGCYGHEDLHTPHLDALANDGVRFTRFHSAAPVCSPTRASCLTGRHPYRCDVRGANRGHLPGDAVTLQRLLHARGYRTGHFGKWHLGTCTKTVVESNRGGPRGAAHFAPPWQRGFDVCFSTEAKVPTFDPMKHPKTGKPYGTHYWNERGEIVEQGLDGDDSRIIVDRVLPFVRDAVKKKKPFLAVVWFHAPHLPIEASAADRARYAEFDDQTQRYYGCITAMDREIGRLRATLAELGVTEDTIVWFCSDNGPEGRKGKAPGSAGPLRGRKRSLYEGGTRVPGLLSWPSKIGKGVVVATPVTTSDFLPTLANWTGTTMPDDHQLDGTDVAPFLQAAMAGNVAERTQPIGFESQRRAAWIDGNFKLVAHLDRKQPLSGIERIELFDLASDPIEAEDLATAEPARATAMRSALEQWRRAIRQRP